MFPLRGKRQRSRAMAARWQVQKVFLFTQPLGGLGVIAKPYDFVHVSNVDIVLVKDDAEWLLLPIHENLTFLCRSSVLRVAHHDDFSRPGISEKNVSVGSNRQPAWILEIRGEYIHAKTLRHGGQKSRGRLLDLWCVAHRLRRERRRQLGLLAVCDLRRPERRQKK